MNPWDVDGWQCFDVEKMPSLRFRNRRSCRRFSGIPFSDRRVRRPFHRSILHTKKASLCLLSIPNKWNSNNWCFYGVQQLKNASAECRRDKGHKGFKVHNSSHFSWTLIKHLHALMDRNCKVYSKVKKSDKSNHQSKYYNRIKKGYSLRWIIIYNISCHSAKWWL